jgi:hypothetical protein
MEDKWYIEHIENEDFIYHCFTFDPKIQEHTFLGKEFIGMDQVNETRDLRMFERVADAGPDGFMPELVNEIKELMGEGNFKYDGYEIGEDEFSLYFLIKKKLYKSVLKKFKQWCEYHEFGNLVYWEEKE